MAYYFKQHPILFTIGLFKILLKNVFQIISKKSNINL